MYPCHVEWTSIFQEEKGQFMKHPQENYRKGITVYNIFCL